mmetsp:Transcript_15985/g.43269  ORF Transcript_15985/g.43269 Transcript_15985/m.43269 type:complete len:835 (-) Transcript_15985:152-2656(-)
MSIGSPDGRQGIRCSPGRCRTRSLAVILRDDCDLLAMAPTGSGKTAVALLAILQAFARGKRAFYTSPIKALSNQKYAEFKQWFRAKGVEGEVTLLTGDIKIRAPPGTRNELIICTSEILRNKLVKTRGIRQRAGAGAAAAAALVAAADPDLENLGCLVSDEVHYINDPKRGSVWEETLMHLPHEVQLVALSATLRNPEHFVDWIARTRKRKGEIVRRTDRHVPLHFGALLHAQDPVDSKFVELYSTHGDKAGVFDKERFRRMFPAKKKAAKGEQKLVQGDTKVNRVVKELDAQDKLPAIVFCMSRQGCEHAARNVKGNPLLSAGYKKKPPPEQQEELIQWEYEEAERSHRVKVIEDRLLAMHRKHLKRFAKELEQLEEYHQIIELLKRGVAYHHAGMLPILREYVEMCFQEKLIRVVFATETLAVGVNMPARTVVFTQLDKFVDKSRDYRFFRCDEFWQMAGRAGRRGMDERGYVIYAPSLFMAGENVPVEEMTRMLTGSMPAAESQLHVDRSFVLRHLGKGFGSEVLHTTMLADQLRRKSAELQGMVKEGKDLQSAFSPEIKDAMARYEVVNAKLSSGQYLNYQESQAVAKEIRDIQAAFPGGAAAFEAERARFHDAQQLQADLDECHVRLQRDWNEAQSWLLGMGFIEPDPAVLKDSGVPGQALTPRGYACTCFTDGHPLIMGTVIADGRLEKLTLPEIAAWLSTFMSEAYKFKDPEARDLLVPSARLEQAWAASFELAKELGVELDKTLGLHMLDWCLHRDIARITKKIRPSMLGLFVKAVAQVVAFIDTLKEVLLGMGFYKTYNKLENHSDALMGGIVTTMSLYLATADD